tara:strand:- start:4648 stop:5013 length:366 start_codon:yes stop_codon:yes gene_type:complete
MNIESNQLKLEYVIIIFLLIIAIVLLFYKSIEPEKPINEVKKPKSILKKTNNLHTVNNSNVKFYDVRMSQISNDINITKNQEPTTELLSQYQPAREDIPTDNIFCNSNNGKIQNKPLRFNI